MFAGAWEGVLKPVVGIAEQGLFHGCSLHLLASDSRLAQHAGTSGWATNFLRFFFLTLVCQVLLFQIDMRAAVACGTFACVLVSRRPGACARARAARVRSRSPLSRSRSGFAFASGLA